MKHTLSHGACIGAILAALSVADCRCATAAVPPDTSKQPAAVAGLPSKGGLVTLPGGTPEIPDKVPQMVDYNLKVEDEKYYVFVPPNHRGTEPFGLLAFIHAGDEMTVPDDWKPLLAKRKLLYLAPQKAGNSQFNKRRMGVTILGICKMMEMCKIDPRRVYVTGHSGGARIACVTAFAHPKLVSAVLPMCGAEFPGPVPKVQAAGDDPYGAFQCDPGLVEKAKKNVGFALITGPQDFRHGHILDIYQGGYLANEYRAKVFDVPGMGHEIAPARVLDLALDWLERREERAKPQKEPDGRKAEEPPASKEKSERADKPEAHPLRAWTDASGKFQVTARFRGVANKVVKLEREDGSIIHVPLEKLSEGDQERIRKREY